MSFECADGNINMGHTGIYIVGHGYIHCGSHGYIICAAAGVVLQPGVSYGWLG